MATNHLTWNVKIIKKEKQEESTKITYIHDQILPADEWIIPHNLKCFPSVTIINSAGEQVFGNVEYINENIIKITFSGIFSGRALLN